MKWLHPSMSPIGSIATDILAGCLTGWSVFAIVVTTPFWPHGICGTGVNDPVSYVTALIPFGLRCLLIRRKPREVEPRGFEVIQLQRSNKRVS